MRKKGATLSALFVTTRTGGSIDSGRKVLTGVNNCKSQPPLSKKNRVERGRNLRLGRGEVATDSVPEEGGKLHLRLPSEKKKGTSEEEHKRLTWAQKISSCIIRRVQ